MQHFYDGQIRRYITQIVRLLSNFSYKDGKGNLTRVPVMYGDITRQVASIIRDNSENKIPSAPRIAVYVTGLEMDRERTSDSSFVSKVHIRERAYDDNNEEYLNTQGKNYTVERLMPTPYKLQLNADIWSTNTEQKLQIMEQILTLFNPSLEIQTTDNYVDWTSLSVVNLEGVTFSTRTIPVGTESEIDIGQLQFSTPIYISPPVKVKKLGVITNIIASIWNEQGTIDLGETNPELMAYDDSFPNDGLMQNNTTISNTDNQAGIARKDSVSLGINYGQYDIIVLNNIAQLVDKGVTGGETWTNYLNATPNKYVTGVTQIQLSRAGMNSSVNGTVAINPSDDKQLVINWDIDTIPSNTIITGPSGDKGTVDKIIDPVKYNPTNDKVAGYRLLLLSDLGDPDNTDGPDAWKQWDGTDFTASANDIIEYDGSSWSIVFDASAAANQTTDPDFEQTYTTNLNTGVQYKWSGTDWVLSFEGEYQKGTWRIIY